MSEHPIAFHKALDLGLKAKKIAKGEVPDQEDVLDNDDGEEVEDKANLSGDDDIAKDKLIKDKAKPNGEPKPKPKPKAKPAATKGKK